MIVIYPMLTSGSVSPNVLPGIVKAVEKYILLYNTDAVLKAAGAGTAGRIISTGAQLATATMMALGQDNTVNPGDPLMEMTPEEERQEKMRQGREKLGQDREKMQQQKRQAAGQVAARAFSGSGVKPSLDLPRSDAVSLEPTWVTVTTAKKGMQILGVKVIPFRVKSGESMSQMILQDKQMKFLEYLASKYGRATTRVFFRLMRKIKLPIIRDKAISGDPKKDIIYGGSQYGKNMFIALNQLDLQNDDLFSTPDGVQKLHKLGWASFVILDDVNRRATFCMKEFGGVCSVVPYGFMFSSLGKDHSKVYEDLEDLKKTSGPFFNMKTNRRRAFAEQVSNVDKYLELIQK